MDNEPQPAGGADPAPPPPSPPPPIPAPPGPTAGPGAGSTAGPDGAPRTGLGGWYNGPVPIESLLPRETIGAAIGRTAVKALTALIVIGGGLVAIPLLLLATIAAVAGATGAGADEPTTARTFVAGDRGGDINLVAVPVTGVILGEDRGGGGGFFSALDVTYGYTVKEELAELAEDASVDGVILELDSPGGTIFGSKAIAEGVEAYRRDTGKPIMAFVSGMSASGGVYSMAGVDEIYADHGTLIGSIGVIFGPFTTYDQVTAIDGGILGGGVTTENGIEIEYLTAGRSKDLGNPYRSMTDEERAVLQRGLDDAYADFVDHVSKGRGIPVSDIENDLGALIFGEQQAVANGLIDAVADRDDTYRRLAEAAGLADGQTWQLERLETGSPSLLSLFTGRLLGNSDQRGADRSGDGLGGDQGAVRIDPLCLGTGSVLAFHGDPAVLCG